MTTGLLGAAESWLSNIVLAKGAAAAAPSTAVHPDLIVEIAFLTDPAADPIWTDVSEHVRSVSTRRGTQRELERFEAGTATVVLDNRDGRFTPRSAASPYYPNVVPMRRIRARALWQDTSYPILTGYIESWPVEYPAAGHDALVQVQAVDAFAVLAQATVTATLPQQSSGARIGALLDAVPWPAADRSIAAGKAIVQAATLAGVPALGELQRVEEAEAGMLFISREGKLTFLDRHHLFRAVSFAGRTFGESSGEIAYGDLELSYDRSLLRNEVTAQIEGGSPQKVSDAASIAKYLRSSISRSGLLLTSDAEALDLATWLVRLYSEPDLRITQITLRPRDTDWASIFAFEIGDRVLVRRRPFSGEFIEQESVITGIAHDIAQQGVWKVVIQVAPTTRAMSWWQLGDATRSVLGSTTRVGY